MVNVTVHVACEPTGLVDYPEYSRRLLLGESSCTKLDDKPYLLYTPSTEGV